MNFVLTNQIVGSISMLHVFKSYISSFDCLGVSNINLYTVFSFAALLRLGMKISADLNVHKTMHLLSQNLYVKLFYDHTNLISNETVQ